jgi:competence protein ComEA
MSPRTLLVVALAAALAGQALAAPAAEADKVNVNTASLQELQLLPRVGPSLAQRIVEFREANGPFKAPEELMRVRGVGERTFELLKPYVTLNGSTTLKKKATTRRKTKPASATEAPPA